MELMTTYNSDNDDNDNNELNLLDHQIEHFDNIKNSLIKYSRAIDASDTGTGKTYVYLGLYVLNQLFLLGCAS